MTPHRTSQLAVVARDPTEAVSCSGGLDAERDDHGKV